MADTKRFGRIRMPVISVYIHTEHASYKITDDTASTQPTNVDKNKLAPSVISFKTTNAMSDDSATFSLVLGSKYGVLWDRVVNNNDLIEIYIDDNEDLLNSGSQATKNKAVMVGLVSEVSIIGDYASNQKTFQITGQSIAKVFSQFKIGMVSEVESEISAMGWLWDSGLSEDYFANSSSYSGDDDSDDSDSDSGSGSGSSGSSSLTAADKKRAGTRSDYKSTGTTKKDRMLNLCKQIGKRLGFTDWKYLGAQCGAESSWGNSGPGAHHNYTGIKYVGQAHASRGSKVRDGSGGYNAYFDSDTDWAVEYARIIAKMDRQSGYTIAKSTTSKQYATRIRKTGYYTAKVEDYTNLISGCYDSVVKYLKGKDSASSTSSSASDSTSSSSSSSSGDSSNYVSSEAISKEKANSEGVAFYGNNVAGIENALLERFQKYITLSYDNGAHDIWSFLDVTSIDSWTQWEKLMDSSSFTNFTGSLYELQKAVLRTPFNEMFYDFNSNNTNSNSQVARMIIRRTPFNPDDWVTLDQLTVDSTNVIEENISRSDREAYSVFVDNPATGFYTATGDSFAMGSYPQTNMDLIKTYGYSKLEVDDYYVTGADDTDWSVSGSTSDDTSTNVSIANNTGTKYTWSDVNEYFSRYSHVTLDQKQDKIAQVLATAANNISYHEAGALLGQYRANGYKMTKNDYDEVLDTENGGGTSNTGTDKLTYNAVNKLLKDSGENDESNFIVKGKKKFKDVSTEELVYLWNQSTFSDSANMRSITKKAYDKAIKHYKKADTENLQTKEIDTDTFQTTLYNWYANNPNWWSGTYTILGNPDARLGMIFNFRDNYLANNFSYPGRRFYIESVSHNFSFTEGFTTEVGVTRGLIAPKNIYSTIASEDPRFSEKYLWGTGVNYEGGSMGEASLGNTAFAADTTDTDTSDDADDDSGSGTIASVAKYAKKYIKDTYTKKTEVYSYGHPSERTKDNPFKKDLNGGYLVFDCSSFVYWCLREKGINPGQGVNTVAQFCKSSKFKKVSIPKSSTKGMKVGDLVIMYNRGHIMIYVGDGYMVGWNGSGSWDTTGGCKKKTVKQMGNHDGFVMRYKG